MPRLPVDKPAVFPKGPEKCPYPVGAWGKPGWSPNVVTSDDGWFPTIHTPYCSSFHFPTKKNNSRTR